MVPSERIADRPSPAGAPVPRLVVGGRAKAGRAAEAAAVPESAFVPVGRREPAKKRRMPRRHVLMLALALEVLWLGIHNADRYRPPGITVEQTIAQGHVIT